MHGSVLVSHDASLSKNEVFEMYVPVKTGFQKYVVVEAPNLHMKAKLHEK